MTTIGICSICGKEFSRDSRDINKTVKRGYNLYCSKECFRIGNIKGKMTGSIVKCASCGRDVYKTPADIKNSISGKVFCSRSCSISHSNIGRDGINNPNYKNGLSDYRETAMKNLGSVCSVCGYSIPKILQVHHKDRDRNNNDVSNLDVLCPTHHREYHEGLRIY